MALALADRQDSVILNADALQVYSDWRILTARPSAEDEACVPHGLYGHVDGSVAYSVGAWLRDLANALEAARRDGLRPIICGGTGLYFSALTEGLAEIPSIPEAIRADGNQRRLASGADAFLADLKEADPEILKAIDTQNPARLQRAWEVYQATGKPMSAWRAETPPPLVPVVGATAIVLSNSPDWLERRITLRLHKMVEDGALEEVRTWLERDLSADLPAAQAIGVPELAAYIRGDLSQDAALEQAVIATRQFAKRQRTWFRSRMKDWQNIVVDEEFDLVGWSRTL